MLSLLLFGFLTAAPDSTPPADPCAGRPPRGAVEAFVVVPPVGARDTIAAAAVCVVPRQTATKIGSYHGEIHFDSTALRVLRVTKKSDGVRVENTTLAGQVNFAGAAPLGLEPGLVLNVFFRVARPGAKPAVRLRMRELNDTAGASLLKQLVTPTSPVR